MEQAVGNLISVDKWKEKLGADKHSFGFTPGIFEFRTKYIHKYGFYILTKESFDNIVEIVKERSVLRLDVELVFFPQILSMPEYLVMPLTTKA